MTTEKQIEANRLNSLLSTGAITEQGKEIVSKNAVKHGIFTKDLIISIGDGMEDEGEYKDLLDNLTISLKPQNQMEYLLVEKIAVDFWRLRRVLRFETASIRKSSDMAIYDYYNKTDPNGNKENKTNEELDEEIKNQKEAIEWNNIYIEFIKKGVISFGNPTLSCEGEKKDIEKTTHDVIEENATNEENIHFNDKEGKILFEKFKEVINKTYSKEKDLSDKLIDVLEKQQSDYKKAICDLEQKKHQNMIAEEISIKMCYLPTDDNADKIMRYEKSIQKSIFQNLSILKRLHSFSF